MKSLIRNIYFKIAVIAFIAILLLLPSAMIMNLIREREGVQQQAIWEVSSKWGNAQTITGPFLTVPYDRYVKQYSEKDKEDKIVKIREYLHFLPTELNIDGKVSPEKRYRGIYEIVVYDSETKIKGVFDQIDYSKFDIKKENIHFEKATLNLGITDLKGIEKQIELNWNNEKVLFNPGTGTNDIVTSGINCPVMISNEDTVTSYSFDLTLDLKGSQYLYFVPVGKSTSVNLNSDWPNPSFDGEYLPDERVVTEKGFKAKWNVFHLNRNYPQSWIGTEYQVYSTAFGVNLLLPVDSYQKTTRVAKYAILLVALTFLVFFFVEVIRKVFIHPIQYILVGIALIVFYTLLLSFSEHMLFNIAYLLSSVLTIGLITWYVKVILKKWNLTLLMSGILMILYSFIFTIIQIQDYTLLIGSIGVFIILALVMYFSRKIDWGETKESNNKIEKK